MWINYVNKCCPWIFAVDNLLTMGITLSTVSTATLNNLKLSTYHQQLVPNLSTAYQLYNIFFFILSIAFNNCISCCMSDVILSLACITVVWSLPPNSSPIFGRERSVSSQHKYIATCLAKAKSLVLFFDLKSSGFMEK